VWTRTPIEGSRSDGDPGSPQGYEVVETVEATLDLPAFGPLFDRFARRDLARQPKRHGHVREYAVGPWYGPPIRIDRSHCRLLGLCSAISIAAGFLSGVISRVLTYAVADFLRVAGDATQTARVANGLAITRFGLMTGFVVLAAADRFGRRRMLAWSCGIGLACCVASAAAPSVPWFVGLQTVARTAASVIAILLAVVLAEELPAATRAYATGMLGLSYALGAGMVLLVLPVADLSTSGWRAVPLAALVLVPVSILALRSLPETRRFVRATAARTSAAARSRFPYGRLLIIAALFLALNVGTAPSTQLQTDYLRTVRHYSAGLIAVFIVVTNFPGAIGVLAGGRLSDRRGRKRLAALGIVGLIVQCGLFMVGGWTMWAVSVASALIGGLAIPTLGAMGPELFPTRSRSTANGVIHLASILGGSLGLWLAAERILSTGYASAFAVLAAFVAISLVLLGLLPETAHLELEEIAPDA
jgi:MFS family permease